MSSVPAKRAVIYHVADEKSEFKLIDWGTNFVVYPLFTIFEAVKLTIKTNLKLNDYSDALIFSALIL